MNSTDKQLRTYYCCVKKWLPGSGNQNKRVMMQIRNAVSLFMAEHPDADYAAIEGHFGAPQEIAASFVGEMETKELLSNLQIRKRLVGTIAVLAVIIVVLWAGFLSYAMSDHISNLNGYVIVNMEDISR